MSHSRCADDSIRYAPPGACLTDNIATTKQHSLDPFWFYNEVRKYGAWDYKQMNPKFQDFGNFNFGVVAAAFGWPYYVAQSEAGRAQAHDGAAKAGKGIPYLKYPYGDDPKDAEQIKAGYQWFMCGCYK